MKGIHYYNTQNCKRASLLLVTFKTHTHSQMYICKNNEIYIGQVKYTCDVYSVIHSIITGYIIATYQYLDKQYM